MGYKSWKYNRSKSEDPYSFVSPSRYFKILYYKVNLFNVNNPGNQSAKGKQDANDDERPGKIWNI